MTSEEAPAAQDAAAGAEDGLSYPLGRVEAGETLEAAPGILLIANPVPFPPGAQNAYALEDVDPDGAPAWTVVDPGLKAGEARWRELLAAGPLGPASGRRLWRVIATHHHPDHIGLAGWLQRAHGAELWTTRTAWLFARMMQLDAWEAPPDEARLFFRRAGFDPAQMARYEARSATNFSVTVAPLPLGYRRIAEGDVVSIGARRWRVLIGHGHAPEHALLLSEADGIALCGDQILPGISPNIGVYATEPEADPLGEWLASCADLGARLSDDLLLLPGHGAPFRGASRRLARYREKHRAALDRLLALLDAPRRASDCFPALYRRAPPSDAEGLAIVETLAHLNRLLAEGSAARTRDPAGGPDLYRAL